MTAPPPTYEAVTGGKSTAPCHLNNAIWLSILSHLVSPRLSQEEQAIGRLDLLSNVRFVCRDFYLTSMHLLRSHYLSDYLRKVQSPYTTNPYPNLDWDLPLRRESEILDLYITIATRAEAHLWESSLYLTNEATFQDLFSHHQPRARLEDLVIGQGAHRGLIHPLSREKWQGVVAEDIKVDLRFKSAALRLRTSSSSLALRTIVEVVRAKEESLELTAKHLLDSLSRLTLSRNQSNQGRIYQVLY